MSSSWKPLIHIGRGRVEEELGHGGVWGEQSYSLVFSSVSWYVNFINSKYFNIRNTSTKTENHHNCGIQ